MLNEKRPNDTPGNRHVDADDEVLTTDESAAFLRLSNSFLAKARRTGTGPAFIEQGRLIKYKKSSLRKWRDEREFRQRRGGVK